MLLMAIGNVLYTYIDFIQVRNISLHNINSQGKYTLLHKKCNIVK